MFYSRQGRRRQSADMKILLIEDDVEISDMLKKFLETQGFQVTAAYEGESACERFFEQEYALVLLDLMIPKMNGMKVMSVIREKSLVPIIILSAKDSDSDKFLGLGLGADDYITKPFSVTEVLARIRANIRRSGWCGAGAARQEEEIITRGDLTINSEDFSAVKRGERIDLTAKEFEILKLLFKNPRKVYTKEQIYASVWKDAYVGDENAVNVHISRLRSKIEDDPRNPVYIVTVWGIGYKAGENFSCPDLQAAWRQN